MAGGGIGSGDRKVIGSCDLNRKFVIMAIAGGLLQPKFKKAKVARKLNGLIRINVGGVRRR